MNESLDDQLRRMNGAPPAGGRPADGAAPTWSSLLGPAAASHRRRRLRLQVIGTIALAASLGTLTILLFADVPAFWIPVIPGTALYALLWARSLHEIKLQHAAVVAQYGLTPEQGKHISLVSPERLRDSLRAVRGEGASPTGD